MLDWLNDLIRAPASCVIRVGGQELSDLYYCLVEVSAQLNRAEASEATLVFETRRIDGDQWSVHDDERIRPWQSIQISATFGTREEIGRATSELQSRENLVCRLLLEKKNQ